MKERRVLECFTLALPVQLNSGGGRQENLLTGDILSKGVFIVTDRPYTEGTSLSLNIKAAGKTNSGDRSKTAITAQGEVIRE